MRMLLGLALVVIVLAIVAGLVKTQLAGLSASGVLPAPGAAPAASGSARSVPAAEQIKRAMEAGTAARASDPER